MAVSSSVDCNRPIKMIRQMQTDVIMPAELLTETTDEILEHAEVVLVGNPAPEFAGVLEKVKPDQIIYDLVRIVKEPGRNRPNYHGICW